MVFTFLKARGLSVGSSLVEDDKLDLVSGSETLVRDVKVPRELERPRCSLLAGPRRGLIWRYSQNFALPLSLMKPIRM